MARYREWQIVEQKDRPAHIVDAIQWWPPGDPRHVPILGIWQLPDTGGYYMDDPKQSTKYVWPGDWIVTGTDNKRWVCPHELFWKNYEPVEGAGQGHMTNAPEDFDEETAVRWALKEMERGLESEYALLAARVEIGRLKREIESLKAKLYAKE